MKFEQSFFEPKQSLVKLSTQLTCTLESFSFVNLISFAKC